MSADEILSRKMAEANRRKEEEEADERKPHLAWLERQRQIDERQRESAAQAVQAAAKNLARDEALFVKAMNKSFSEREIEVLRFLKEEFLAKGEKPQGMWDKANAIYHKEVRKKFGLSNVEYLEMIARFMALGIVDYNTSDTEQGIIHVHAGITEWMRQIDEEALRKKAERRDIVAEVKKWAASKPYLAYPYLFTMLVLFLVGALTAIFAWYGIASHK
jgi:hypothetical protein